MVTLIDRTGVVTLIDRTELMTLVPVQSLPSDVGSQNWLVTLIHIQSWSGDI